MNNSPIRGILLDIEGTTSSISFVYDKMFPYVRENLVSFLDGNWENSDVQECLPLLAVDLGEPDVEKWLGENADQGKGKAAQGVIQLMDGDVKATGLKQLQGLIWKNGFHSGQLVAHLFEDVAPAIAAWNDAGIDVRIYSSGSIAAQKLFFGHCVAGDLLDQFKGHYDTTTGPKKESESYEKIAGDFSLSPSDVLFVSDVVDELTAASTAGMQTVLSLRPGNKSQGDGHKYQTISSFDQIEING
jgi:enolase-phosphatase E1